MTTLLLSDFVIDMAFIKFDYNYVAYILFYNFSKEEKMFPTKWTDFSRILITGKMKNVYLLLLNFLLPFIVPIIKNFTYYFIIISLKSMKHLAL